MYQATGRRTRESIGRERHSSERAGPEAGMTLADLLADPTRAAEVPRDDLMRLLITIALALIGEPRPQAVLDAFSDTLSVREAARLLGISPTTLSHRARREPYSGFLQPTGTRRLAFSRRAIEAWQMKQHNPVMVVPQTGTRYDWMKAKR